jgi:hypothetical protein
MSANLLLLQTTTLLGHNPANITVKAMHATGALTLITTRIHSNLIRLLDRWQSDVMLRYLHVQSVWVIQNFAHAMNLHLGLPSSQQNTHTYLHGRQPPATKPKKSRT